MKSKFLLVLIVCILAIGSITPTFAETPVSSNILEIKPIINNLLCTIRLEPAAYGLDNVDFDNLSICEAITVYQDRSDKIKKANIKYYPIMDGNNIVAIATVSYTKKGEASVQIGKDFATELQNVTNKNQNIALVFNEAGDKLYACNDKDKFTILHTFSFDKSNDNALKEFKGCKDKDVEFTQPKAVSDLNVDLTDTAGSDSLILSSDLLATTSSDYHYINVPIKSQYNLPICWAASVASIGQYETGTNYTSKKVCDLLGLSYVGASMTTAKNALSTLYSINGTSHTSAPTFTVLMSEINANDPMWAGFKSPTTGAGHAFVIRGFATGSTYANFSYMDSNFTTFQVSSITTDGVYTITYGTDTMKCNAYISI